MAKKNINYYTLFIEAAGYSCDEARELKNAVENFDGNLLAKNIQMIHTIEHTADEKKHVLMENLSQEFITPIEREDIVSLAQELDDVTDAIEEIFQSMYMYNAQNTTQEAIEFAHIILKSCECIRELMTEIENFKKSKVIKDIIIRLNDFEDEGDRLYMKTMRELYMNTDDPLKIIIWSRLYQKFEDCCDHCENVAKVVEGVIMKNS
ncbi:MAG: DUF47 family protein [Clostridiales bacterium]|nr:DUF47 family protein [Clostridiales bacterium]